MPFPWLTPETIELLWRGIGFTVILTLITSLLSFGVGVVMGTVKLSGQRGWRRLAMVYIEIHRNIPALVLIIFWAFAVPNLFPQEWRQAIFFRNELVAWLGQLTGLSVPYYAFAATLGLTLNTSAYLAELFRAGIGAIPQEHVDAARSLGGNNRAIFWRILLPEGVRMAFPAMSTRLIHNMKNTALAAFVSVPEFFQMTQTAITRTFRAIEFLILAAVVYLLLSCTMSLLLHGIDLWLQRRRVPVLY